MMATVTVRKLRGLIRRAREVQVEADWAIGDPIPVRAIKSDLLYTLSLPWAQELMFNIYVHEPSDTLTIINAEPQ